MYTIVHCTRLLLHWQPCNLLDQKALIAPHFDSPSIRRVGGQTSCYSYRYYLVLLPIKRNLILLVETV